MPHPLVDLAYLERFCQSDRSRMAKYIALYLAEAPALFARLEQAATVLEAAELAASAHDLRPMMHQMGARPLMHLLTAVEERAPVEGAAACAASVREALAMSAQVDAELRDALGRLSAS